MTNSQPPLNAPSLPISALAPVVTPQLSEIAKEVILSVYNNMRKRAIQDAILNELVHRNNAMLTAEKPPKGNLGVAHRLPLDYLANSMKNAREHDRRVWELGQQMSQGQNQ